MEQVEWFAVAFSRIVDNIGEALAGKEREIRLVVIGLLSGGHVLIEDTPGTGKSIIARALSSSFEGTTARVEFHPDLVAADLVGQTAYDAAKSESTFRAGPVFSNIVLVDRMNQGAPQVQTALLEIMADRRVTVDATPRELPQPFFVIATQNPASTAAPYPLAGEQLDRFMLRLSLGYPDDATVIELLTDPAALRTPDIIFSEGVAIAMIQLTSDVHLDPAIAEYINRIVKATQRHEALRAGASMRGALALARAARTLAMSRGRQYVIPEDVAELAVPVLAHRLTPKEAEAGRAHTQTTEQIIERILLDITPPVQRDVGSAAAATPPPDAKPEPKSEPKPEPKPEAGGRDTESEMVEAIENRFERYADNPTKGTLDELYVMIGALKILGFEKSYATARERLRKLDPPPEA
jgi:MoxR-like ATPase